ncbi:MAG: Holliday junction resolvase RuvX [Gemmatimonadales bacterium]
MGRILALDWGEIRFGVARSDEGQILASPLTTLTRRAGKRFPMPQLLALLDAEPVVGIVVGLPISLEGAETPSSEAARALADHVGRRTGLPVELADERFTTAIALDAVREMGGSTRGRKSDVDALAATVLLQQYLDFRRAPTP